MGGGRRRFSALCSASASAGRIHCASTISSPSTFTIAPSGNSATKNQVANRRFIPTGVNQCEKPLSADVAKEMPASSNSSLTAALRNLSNSEHPESFSSTFPPGNIQTLAILLAAGLRLRRSTSGPNWPRRRTRTVDARIASSPLSRSRFAGNDGGMSVGITTVKTMQINMFRIV